MYTYIYNNYNYFITYLKYIYIKCICHISPTDIAVKGTVTLNTY